MEQVEERLDELAYLEDSIWKEERNTAKNEKEVRPPPLCQSLSTTLEATQGQIDGFFSQLPFKCYLPEVASVGD